MDEQYVTFHRDAVVESIEDCNRTLLICTHDTFDMKGGASCEPLSESSSTNQCDASFLCTQGAMLGDEAVEIRGNLSTTCYASGDVWSCECRNYVRGVTVSIPALDSADACARARLLCAEAIPVFEWGSP